MLEKQRHQLILDILAEQQFASVRALSSQLSASEATIRRDITKMAANGQLNKIRGGAEVNGDATGHAKRGRVEGTFFLEHKEIHASNKRRIAQRAVELIEDDEAIIINGGTTTYMMGEYLVDRNVSILTNSFVLAQYLTDNGTNQVTVPGGEIYRKQGIILSAFENDTIQHYHGSKMFTGTPGISEQGVAESDPLLIRAEHKLKKQSDKMIVLADSSKLGKRANFIFTPLSEVDVLITDSNADPDIIRQFEALDVEVITVAAAVE